MFKDPSKLIRTPTQAFSLRCHTLHVHFILTTIRFLLKWFILQAWVLRVFSQSQFQDWENHYIIDRKLLSSCVRWILGYQNNDGSFSETRQYSYPLDRRLVSLNSGVLIKNQGQSILYIFFMVIQIQCSRVIPAMLSVTLLTS